MDANFFSIEIEKFKTLKELQPIFEELVFDAFRKGWVYREATKNSNNLQNPEYTEQMEKDIKTYFDLHIKCEDYILEVKKLKLN